jgi:hypothetical protein
VLEPVIAEKLTNIATARLALESGELPVWKLPVIVDLTRAHLSIQTGSMYDRLVGDTVQQIEADERWVQAALSALGIAIALVGLLAAPFTGGSSFGVGLAAGASIASGGLSAYLIYEEIQRYQLDAAASGTDFDKARALSMADPSLFWLAAVILGAGLDLFDALQAFRVLRQTVRSAVQARRVAADAGEIGARLDEITEYGNNLSPGLGDQIRARVEAGQADNLFDDLLPPEERGLTESLPLADEVTQITPAGPTPLQMLPTGSVLGPIAARQRLEDSLVGVWMRRDSVTQWDQIYTYYSSHSVDLAAVNRNPFSDTTGLMMLEYRRTGMMRRLGDLESGRPAGSLSAGQDGLAFMHYYRAGAARKVRDYTRLTRTITERIYISTTADNAMDVMDHVVRKIVDDPVTFPGVVEAKVAGPEQVTERFDSIVIYLEDQASVPAVLQELATYQGANPTHFVDYALPMTEPSFTGVSVAAQPPATLGESVGRVYADVVFKALTESKAAGEEFWQFQDRVVRGLTALQIDPNLPHRM